MGKPVEWVKYGKHSFRKSFFAKSLKDCKKQTKHSHSPELIEKLWREVNNKPLEKEKKEEKKD